jgi:transporter family protein
MWAIFALGAALLTSFNPILYKRILKDADPLIVVWAVTLLGLPLLAIFTFTLTSSLLRVDWIFLFAVIGSAALNAVAHLASTKALKLEDVSVVTPLLTFSPAFTLLIAAIFLRETPSTRGLIGVGLLLAGAYGLNASFRPGSTQATRTDWLTPFTSLTRKPGVLLVLLAGLLWAITPIFEKTAIQHTDPLSPRFTALIVDILLVLFLSMAAVYRGRSSLGNLRPHRRELLLAGMIAGSAPVMGYTAFSLGPVGYVTALFKFSAIITVMWGALFLKEHDLQRRFPSSLLMVLGAILLTA